VAKEPFMKKEHISLIIALSLIVFCFYLFYRLLNPFLEPILWAIFLTLVLFPSYKKFQHLLRKKGFVPAILMTLLVMIVIALPFSLLLLSLANEAVGVYHSVENLINTGQLQAYLEKMKEIPILGSILPKIDQALGLSQMDPLALILKNLRQISTLLLNQSSVILRSLSSFLFSFFLALLSLYYLFKDGEHFYGKLKNLLPIPARERDLLLNRFQEMVSATIYGGLLIALVQGLLGGLSFWVLGLSSPVLWGTAMALFSFIPLGGTALIWVPAAIFLLMTGEITQGIILLAIGVFVISSVDNFLRPLLVGAKTNIHPLLLFFAVIGGIQAFGMIGIIAGPLIVTLCLTLVEIYAGDNKGEPVVLTKA
jgi:predicted PurR-regulated permease PerM